MQGLSILNRLQHAGSNRCGWEDSGQRLRGDKQAPFDFLWHVRRWLSSAVTTSIEDIHGVTGQALRLRIKRGGISVILVSGRVLLLVGSAKGHSVLWLGGGGNFSVLRSHDMRHLLDQKAAGGWRVDTPARNLL